MAVPTNSKVHFAQFAERAGESYLKEVLLKSKKKILGNHALLKDILN